MGKHFFPSRTTMTLFDLWEAGGRITLSTSEGLGPGFVRHTSGLYHSITAPPWRNTWLYYVKLCLFNIWTSFRADSDIRITNNYSEVSVTNQKSILSIILYLHHSESFVIWACKPHDCVNTRPVENTINHQTLRGSVIALFVKIVGRVILL